MTGKAPQLCRGLALVAAGGSLLVDGASRRQYFSGRAVTSALKPLLPLMDGVRDTGALAAAAGVAPETVDQVVGLLEDCGLVEYPDPDRSPSPGAPPHVLSYFSRTIGVTGGHRSAEGLLALLARGSVTILGTDTAAEQLAEDLAEVGLGLVRRVAADFALPDAERCDAVVVFDERHRPERLNEVVAACYRSGTPVLRCARDDDTVQVGPLFLGDFTACADCFRRGERDADTVEVNGGPAVSGAGLLAGLAAGEILAVLARATEPTSVRMMTTVSLSDLTTQRWLVTPYPDCARCRGHLAPDGDGGMGEDYEWQMERLPQALAWTGQLPRVSRQRYEAMQRQRAEFPLSPRRTLPPDGSATAVPDSLLTAVAGVLRRAVGVRSRSAEPLARWTASGGNLGSAEAFVIAEAGLFGLPGTVVRYDDLADEVVAVRSNPVPVARCLKGSGLSPDGVEFVVVLIAAVGRLANKYGRFAYRLAHLDAGCAAVSLAAAAAGHGLAASFAAGWPDDLAEVLDLEPGREIITAVAGFRVHGGGV